VEISVLKIKKLGVNLRGDFVLFQGRKKGWRVGIAAIAAAATTSAAASE